MQMREWIWWKNYSKDATVAVGLALVIKDVQQVKIVSFGNVEIVHVVSWSDFQSTWNLNTFSVTEIIEE